MPCSYKLYFQSHNRDYLLLVGTALAMVLNCAPSLEMTQVSYMEILSLLAEGNH